MRAFVRLGNLDTVAMWEAGVERAERFLHLLGLASSIAPASDPFFGDVATFLRSSQEEQKLKVVRVSPCYRVCRLGLGQFRADRRFPRRLRTSVHLGRFNAAAI